MTTPSSLEELREKMGSILSLLENHVASDVTRRIVAQMSGTSPKARHHEAMQSLESLFRSHMEAVIEDLIGEKEYYREHYPFVITEEQHIEMKERLARDELRHEMRKRAKSYLEGENTSHE